MIQRIAEFVRGFAEAWWPAHARRAKRGTAAPVWLCDQACERRCRSLVGGAIGARGWLKVPTCIVGFYRLIELDSRIADRTMLRFQAGLLVFSASAARVFVRIVSTRSGFQPFASGSDSVARSASTASTAASIS